MKVDNFKNNAKDYLKLVLIILLAVGTVFVVFYFYRKILKPIECSGFILTNFSAAMNLGSRGMSNKLIKLVSLIGAISLACSLFGVVEMIMNMKDMVDKSGLVMFILGLGILVISMVYLVVKIIVANKKVKSE